MSVDTIRQALRDSASGVSAGGLTLLDARAVVGMNVEPPSSEFFLTLQTAGPFMVVMPAVAADYDPHEFYAAYDITIYVWFGFNRDANEDFKNFEQWLDAMRGLWVDFSTLGALNVNQPTKGPKWKRTVDPDIKPGVVLYTIEMTIGEDTN